MRAAKRLPCIPLLLSLLLFAVCLWCGWQIYESHCQMTALADARNAEYAGLQQREEAFRELLRLSPCEARDKAGASLPWSHAN